MVAAVAVVEGGRRGFVEGVHGVRAGEPPANQPVTDCSGPDRIENGTEWNGIGSLWEGREKEGTDATPGLARQSGTRLLGGARGAGARVPSVKPMLDRLSLGQGLEIFGPALRKKIYNMHTPFGAWLGTRGM